MARASEKAYNDRRMPRFQPGQHRYFGANPKPVASVTAGLIPFSSPALINPPNPAARPLKSAKPAPFVIGKTERTAITQKLLKMPHYVPSGTQKSLKNFAKLVIGHQKDFFVFYLQGYLEPQKFGLNIIRCLFRHL